MDLPANRVVLGFLYLVALAKAFRRFKDPRRREAGRHLSRFYARAWSEAAKRFGGTYEPLGAEVGQIVLGDLGDCRIRVMGNYTSIDDPVTLAVASNKPLTYRLLAEQRLRTPRYLEFTLNDLAPAFAFMEGGRECVVKPSSGTGGGRGIMTGVRSRWDLAKAAAAAAVYGENLLIEEHLEGDNYRLLYLDGVLIDCFARRPPNVVADGRSTILRLVQVANGARLLHGSGLSQNLLTIDLDMRRTLEKRGLSLNSIPAEGTVVTLKTVINENCGSDNTSATHLLCRSIIDDGARAARALGIRLAGIDVITTDPNLSLAESGGAIIDVNTPPNYYYHYHKRDGAFPVALPVLKRLLSEQRRTTGMPVGTAAALPHEERLSC